MLEQIRDRGSEAVLAVYRLVKNAMIHAVDNDAVRDTAKQSAEILRAFAGEVGMPVTLTFVDETVFVCAELLRASRKVYESALELGQILGRLEVSELEFQGEVSHESLLAFAGALSLALREADKKDAFVNAKIQAVSVRKVERELVQKKRDDDLAPKERNLRFYATALVAMRQFFDEVALGHTLLPHRVKRLSQRLVALGEMHDGNLLGTMALAAAHRDDAGRAVQSAVLAVAIGRQITDDRAALARLGMSALMADVGRVRVAGPLGRDRLVPFTDSQQAATPGAAALVCIATGGVNHPNALRTVTAMEVNWAESVELLGLPWGGRLTPLLHTRILVLVRRVLAIIAPRDTAPGCSPATALEQLAADPEVDRVLLRLLVRAVGVLPTGSVVELEGGEWAVVVGPSSYQESFPAPTLKLVTDRRGRALNVAGLLDLGDPALGARRPKVARLVEPEQARFNVARVFFA
jgi:hypothetical protein